MLTTRNQETRKKLISLPTLQFIFKKRKYQTVKKGHEIHMKYTIHIRMRNTKII